MRTCIGCRNVRTTEGLLRFVIEGTSIVEGRSRPGRGAWLCSGSLECLEAATRSRAFPRALRSEVDPASIAAVATAWRAGAVEGA